MCVAVDDHSRYATVCVLEDETAESVTKHLTEHVLSLCRSRHSDKASATG